MNKRTVRRTIEVAGNETLMAENQLRALRDWLSLKHPNIIREYDLERLAIFLGYGKP